MKKTITNLVKPTAMLGIFAISSMNAIAQAPALVSTVSGKVWVERDGVAADGVQNAGEVNLSGILVRMIVAPNRVIAVGMTDASGNYTLNNYEGLGTYTIQFHYPNEAFVGVSPTAATLGGSESHVSRSGNNTTATVNVTAPAQINTINMGLRRNLSYIVRCGTYSGTTTWSQNVALQKFDYDAVSVGLNALNLWSATNSYHEDIVVTENSNTATNMQVRIGIQTTVNMPATNPIEEFYSLSANTQIVQAFSGNETKHFYNRNSSSIHHQGSYSLDYAPVNAGAGTVEVPVMVEGQTTFTGATNFNVILPTVASFGACLVYELSSPLAVSLISLKAGLENGMPKLDWKTAAERDSRGFNIEHSLDGKVWSTIGFVASKGENGNSIEQLSYDFVHPNATAGKNFYRLNQIDHDGTSTLSKVVTISLGNLAAVSVYPNVIDQHNTAFTIEGLSGNSEVAIFNLNGTRIAYFSSVKNKEIVDMSFAPVGLYNIVVKDFETATVKTEKIIKR